MAIKKSDREAVWNKFDKHCAYCGESLNYSDLCMDNVIPQCNFVWHIKNQYKIPPFLAHLTLEDVNHSDNVYPSCQSCYTRKEAHDLESFRQQLFLLVDQAEKSSEDYRMAVKYNLIEVKLKPVVFYFETL